MAYELTEIKSKKHCNARSVYNLLYFKCRNTTRLILRVFLFDNGIFHDLAEAGIGLIGFGIFFTFLGVVLFFDRGLLALGNVRLTFTI